jgi:hypothetical protein
MRAGGSCPVPASLSTPSPDHVPAYIEGIHHPCCIAHRPQEPGTSCILCVGMRSTVSDPAFARDIASTAFGHPARPDPSLTCSSLPLARDTAVRHNRTRSPALPLSSNRMHMTVAPLGEVRVTPSTAPLDAPPFPLARSPTPGWGDIGDLPTAPVSPSQRYQPTIAH